jgi:asparagine synthase (glutamine-hydrolysing)
MSFLGTLTTPSAGEPHLPGAFFSFSLGRSALLLSAPDLHESPQRVGGFLRGRLFNAEALRQQLQVPSAGDTEVLLHAYAHWGLDFPNRLAGEFSFVLWDARDARTARLLLGRDPSGLWPLFYAQPAGSLVFADHVHPLLRWPGISSALDEQHIAHWLALTASPALSTFFRDITYVPPGHMLEWHSGNLTLHRFWQPEHNTPELRLRDSREYAEAARALLADCIRDRIGPAPVATHLSGGLDSASVTALTAELLAPQGRRLLAVTSVPQFAPGNSPRRFGDEREHAAAVAAMYPNIDHQIVSGEAHELLALIDRFSDAIAQPVFNAGNHGWLHDTCLAARAYGASTIFSGTGGNLTLSFDATAFLLPDLLAQGRLADAFRMARDLQANGALRWRGVAHSALRPWLPRGLRAFADRRRGLQTETTAYSFINPDFARSHALSAMAMEDAHRRRSSREIRLRQLHRIDPGPFRAASRLLSRVDITSPETDPRLIEFALALPIEVFAERGVPRSLIRNAMAGRLPEQVRNERRRGLQGSDMQLRLHRDRDAILAEIAAFRHIDLLARAVDLDGMARLMQRTHANTPDPSLLHEWPRLLRAFALGRFVLRLQEGTLFDTLPQT